MNTSSLPTAYQLKTVCGKCLRKFENLFYFKKKRISVPVFDLLEN